MKGEQVALLALVVTTGIALLGWAKKYLDERIEARVQRAEASQALGDGDLANAIQLLNVTLESMTDRWMTSETRQAEKLDRVVHEFTYTNDGSTVKGAVSKAKEHLIRVDGHLEGIDKHLGTVDIRLDHLEEYHRGNQ